MKSTPVEREAVATQGIRAVHKDLRREQIVPDQQNRLIARDEDFHSLVDSIRVLGILQDLIVQERPDGTYRLVDGERRWHAAGEARLEVVPCKVWPADVHGDRLIAAGIIVNDQRKPPTCIHVARRLREMKHTSSALELTHEQIAERTGLALDRVKKYFSLLVASDFLLEFFDEHDVSLKVAVAFVRYEKASNEARARRLVERHLEEPLTSAEIDHRRAQAGEKKAEKETTAAHKVPRLAAWVQSALKRDAAGTHAQLAPVFADFGMKLLAQAPSESFPRETSPPVRPPRRPPPPGEGSPEGRGGGPA